MPDDAAPGKVTAYLAGVRERTERPLPHVTSLPIGHPGVRTLMESAADVPRLLAVAEVVLKRHRRSAFPATMGEHRGRHFCPACTASVDHQVLYVDWPCPEYADASRALLGERGSGG